MNEDQAPTQVEDPGPPRLERFKNHLRENKKVYLTSAGCLCIGFISGKHFQRPIVVAMTPTFNNTVAPVIAPVMNNIGNHLVNNVGNVCKIVQDLNDPNKLWPKAAALAAELAEEHGVTLERAKWLLSRHLNGHDGYETLWGKSYVTYGLGTNR